MNAISYYDWMLLRVLARWEDGKLQGAIYKRFYCVDGKSNIVSAIGCTLMAERAVDRLTARGDLFTIVTPGVEHGFQERSYFVMSPMARSLAEGPPPARTVPSLEPLDLSQRHIREVLFELKNSWCLPMEFGGSNGSHHSRTAAILCRHGYVERRQRRGTQIESGPMIDAPRIFPRERGSFVYRLTSLGVAAQDAIKEEVREYGYDAVYRDAPVL